MSMDEIIKEFLAEAREHQSALLVRLDELANGQDLEPALEAAYRHFHTIKGACGFLGYGQLENVTRIGERMFGTLRKAHRAPQPDEHELLVEAAQAMEQLIDRIDRDGGEGDADYNELTNALGTLADAAAAAL